MEYLHEEVIKIKQWLVNNNFPLAVIDRIVNEFIQQQVSQNKNDSKESVKLFYESQMCTNYKLEEKQIRDIIKKNVKARNDDKQVKLEIYYKIRKLRNVVIVNNPHKRETEYNVVYQYKCNKGECQSQEKYIGYTEQTLQDRFRQHQSVLKHLKDKHNINREKPNDILQSVTILYRSSTKQELNNEGTATIVVFSLT